MHLRYRRTLQLRALARQLCITQQTVVLESGKDMLERSQEGTSADYLNVSLYLICTSKGDGRRQPH